MVVVSYILVFHLVLVGGGVVGASSLPHYWDTMIQCEEERARAEEYLRETRKDAVEISVTCQIHRRLVDEEEPTEPAK